MLQNNTAFKFTFADFGFLYMMHKKDPKSLDGFKELVKQGRIELLGGGYIMADNASPSFDEILANYQYGRHFLNTQFDQVPDTLWNLDLFGVSGVNAQIARYLGYNQQVFSRLNFQMEAHLNHTRGYLFRHHDHLRDKDWLISLKTPGHYDLGFPLRTDRGLFNGVDTEVVMVLTEDRFNFWFLACSLVVKLNKFHALFNQRDVFLPFGGDFFFSNFQDTAYLYESLIIFVDCNNLSGRYAGLLKIKASLPRDYFKEVKQ